MLALVLADVGLGPIAREPTTPVLVSLGLFTTIVVSEGWVLWAFRRKSLGRLPHWGNCFASLLDALIMNTVSTVIGFGLTVLTVVFPTEVLRSLPSPILLGLFVLTTWGLSVLIEGLVLQWRKWNGAKWQAAAVANAVSYGLLVLVILTSLGWLQ